jgi:Xaa-Pro aminopeptidase
MNSGFLKQADERVPNVSTTGFNTQTYRDRIARAQQEMASRGIDTLILGPGADLTYLTGFHAHESERLNLLVLKRSGTPDFVAPLFEVPVLGDDPGALANLLTWSDGEDPAAIAARSIGKGGTIAARSIGKGGTIAVGAVLASVFLIRLQQRVDATWVESAPLMSQLRMLKDEGEIAALQAAASRTDAAWEEFIATATITGLTEVEARQILLDLTAKHGVFDPHGICGSGPNSASPHHNAGDRRIQPGDSVVFDWGGTVDGYWSDVTRTVHIGEPSEEYIRCYNLVLNANQAALDAMTPGTPMEQVDIAARTVIENGGYGEYFLHRLGHGLGLEIHEDPYVVRGNDLPLAPGMVFSDEPGIYIAGKFGIRIEDSVLATEEGGRRLNEGTRDLVIMT